MVNSARSAVLRRGAYLIMIESEGITENVKSWRTDVPAKVIGTLGLERVMFEAVDPAVFTWYVKNYGPEVNLFVDQSQPDLATGMCAAGDLGNGGCLGPRLDVSSLRGRLRAL
jgi:phosphosulfolactate synthase (CoM biosynthesis protein A)